MIIQSARFNIVFPRVNNIRKKAFEIEDRLTPHYSPVTLIPVPDDAPELIPRIQTTSRSGHSNIEISLTSAQVVVNYDDDFNGDWKKCFEYLKTRAGLMSHSLFPYLQEGVLFSGVTVESVVSDVPAIDLIKNQFLNYRSNLQPHDLEYKLAYVLNQENYINLGFRNSRTFEGMLPANTGMIDFSTFKEKSNVLAITVDINDRHAFNSDSNYRSDSNSTDQLFSILESLFDGKIQKMIQEGVIDL